MSEFLYLDKGGKEFESRPDNTTLFTFLGHTALNGINFENARANHIFFQDGMEDEATMTGSYMFRTEDNANIWDTIATHIMTNDYPMILNRREVPACDWEAYSRMLDQSAAAETVEDFFPEEWT
jgi:hypothetical protein